MDRLPLIVFTLEIVMVIGFCFVIHQLSEIGKTLKAILEKMEGKGE
jgi:hypothetical protein